MYTIQEKVSIFEADSTENSTPTPEKMVVKSVSLDENIEGSIDEEAVMTKQEVMKLKKTLQKASSNMKILKERYKRV